MIHLYYMDISCDCSYEQSLAFYKILPDEKKARIDRLRNEELAAKQTLAGAFLQHVLSKELGISVKDISYKYGEQGKPFLSDSTVDFNLSHSGKYAAAAVSDGPVGIDVEHVRGKRLNVAKRFFADSEYEDILNAGDDEKRAKRFLEYWTMKEAYIKREGGGLSIPLDSFVIARGKNGLSYVENEDVWFRTYSISDEYCLSVCSILKNELEGLREPMKINLENIFC